MLPKLFWCVASLFTALTAASSPYGAPPRSPAVNGKVCTVKALGNQTDDVPQILEAFAACNNSGTIVFPEDQNYWIGSRLNPVISDVTIEWRGLWTVSHYSEL